MWKGSNIKRSRLLPKGFGSMGYISLQDGRIFREIDSDDILFKMFRLENENKKLKEENEQLRQKLDFYLLDEFEWKEKYGD